MRKSDSRPQVMHACKILTESPASGATYAAIREMTGLSLSVIKDHAQRAFETGELIRAADGFYRTPPPARDHCNVYINVMPDRRRRDLDNLLKGLLDALTHAGLWLDDSQVVDLRIRKAPTIGGMVKVGVQQVGAA